MKYGTFAFSIGIAVVCTLAGSALGQAPPSGAYPGMYGGGAKPGGPPPEVTQPMTLTDAQVQGFFAAANELKALGEEAGANGGADASNPEAFARSLRVSNQGMAILQKHGFKDPAEFQRVGYNAAMAYGIVEQGGKQAMDAKLREAETEQAKAMEEMQRQMSPQQFEMMKGHLGAAMGMAKSMQDVPESNIELMKKYGDQMENLSKN
jgi:hypothetical protein